MSKLKYILIIISSIIAGIIIGWFIWGGGELTINVPKINLMVDTVYVAHTDTITNIKTKVKYDTLSTQDSVYLTKLDTVYRNNFNDLTMPFNIGNGFYVTKPFGLTFEFYSKKDTVIPTFYFPSMIADVVWKHGADSIMVEYKVKYMEYWYNNIYVEILKDIGILTIGYYLNTFGGDK